MILLNINLKEMIEIRDAGGHRIKMISSWKKNSSFHIFWLQIPSWSHLKFYSCLFYSDIKRLGLLLQHDMRACGQWLHWYNYDLLSITHNSNISIFWCILSVLGFWLSMLLEKRYRVYDNRLLRTFDYRSHNVFRKGDVL